MLLYDIVSTIMQHSSLWSTFTVDAFLTVINLICKSLFYHQPFKGLSSAIKLFAKKKYKVG